MASVIRTQDVAREQLIDLGDVVLVASKSDPGAWHEVRAGTCTCRGFAHRGHCRHVVAVEQAQLVPCFRCGAPTRPSESGSVAVCGPCSRALTSLDD